MSPSPAAAKTGWRRESRIAEAALRLTGVLGGAAVGALACALSDSARSRPLLVALALVGAGLGYWAAEKIQLRLPPAAGGPGLNALSPTWQGVLFLVVAALAGGLLLFLFPAYPRLFRSPWLHLWAWVTAGIAAVLGFAALLYRVDFRWFGLFNVSSREEDGLGRGLAAEVIIELAALLLPPPLNLGLLLYWLKLAGMGDGISEEEDERDVYQYGKFVLLLVVGLGLVLGLLVLGLKKLGFR